MLGKIEGRKQRGHQWMRWLDSITNSVKNELGQTLGDGEGQGGLACCSPWGYKELDMTGLLNKNNNKHIENCNSYSVSSSELIFSKTMSIISNFFD